MRSTLKLVKAMRLIGGIMAFVATIVVLGAGGIGPSAQPASANHTTAPNEITIASSAANTAVPLGSNFDVTLAVTTSTDAYKAIQWELAYSPNVSFVSAVYNCPQFPSEAESPPLEDASAATAPSLVPLTLLGGGAACLSLSSPFVGTNTLGTFVTVTLRCVSNGTSPVIAVDEATDPIFGTFLSDRIGGVIPTTLENQYATQSHATQAGFDVTCGGATSGCFTPEGGTFANQVPGDGASDVRPVKSISFDYTPCLGKGRAVVTVTIDGIELPGPISWTTAPPSLFLHFDVAPARQLHRGRHDVQVTIAEFACDTCSPTYYNGSWSFVVGKSK